MSPTTRSSSAPDAGDPSTISDPSPPDPRRPRRRRTWLVAAATGMALGVATVAIASVLTSGSSADGDFSGDIGTCPRDPTVTIDSATITPLDDGPNPLGFFTLQVSGTIVNNSETSVTASVQVPLTAGGDAPLYSGAIEVGPGATAPYEAKGPITAPPGTTNAPGYGAADLAWQFYGADLAHCSRAHLATE